jgi:hypothetical protein
MTVQQDIGVKMSDKLHLQFFFTCVRCGEMICSTGIANNYHYPLWFKRIGPMRMKITPEAVADLVFEACPSYREAWPDFDAGKPTDTIYSVPILIGLAGHVAGLWRRRQFSEFPAIFDLVERLHVEGNKKGRTRGRSVAQTPIFRISGNF